MDNTSEITMLKQKVDKQGKEIEDLRRELDAVKSIVNAGRTSMDELGTKLDKAIANYKSSTRLYK